MPDTGGLAHQSETLRCLVIVIDKSRSCPLGQPRPRYSLQHKKRVAGFDAHNLFVEPQFQGTLGEEMMTCLTLNTLSANVSISAPPVPTQTS